MSEKTYWGLVAAGMIGVIGGAIGFFGLPQTFADLMKVAGWMSIAVGALAFFVFCLLVYTEEYYSAELLVLVVACAISAPLVFFYPEGAERRKVVTDCQIAGGEWKYQGEEEGYSCMKEYQSCGPDESKPRFTICEKKFKRVQPEAN